MKLFGEKYSREAFDKAEQETEWAEYSYRYHGTDNRLGVYKDLMERAAMARERVKKLYAKGQKEAMGLNAEYNALQKNVDEALQALYKFEKEKLGMQGGEEQEGE